MSKNELVWDNLTLAEWQYVSKYIRICADKMGLKDWRIALDRNPISEPSTAQCRVFMSYGMKEAEITLCKNWSKYRLHDKANYIHHELTHCHLNVIDTMAGNDLNGHISEQVREVFARGYSRQLEIATDAIASAFTPLLPPYSFKVK